MPEYPDVTVYIEALSERIAGQTLEGVRLSSPFLLRTATPPIAESFGRRVVGLERMGKRIVFGLEGDLFLVLHLMVAGRLHWKPAGAAIAKKRGLCAFDFPTGSLELTEAGTKKRASLHVAEGRQGLAQLDPGGLEVPGSSLAAFRDALTAENHTLKRALTDPRSLSGIGNAYCDEILHRAGLSPIAQTQKLPTEAFERLHRASLDILTEWTERLRAQTGDGFPEKVTAFRPEMAVHGKYGAPCPVCKDPVQRIRYAKNETNYCPTCQTGGKLLADRALSRLLKKDWPRTLEDLEEYKVKRSGGA